MSLGDACAQRDKNAGNILVRCAVSLHQVSEKMGGIAKSVANGSEVVVQKLALSSGATANSIKVSCYELHSSSHWLLGVV